MDIQRSRVSWLHRALLALVTVLSVMILAASLSIYGGVDLGGFIGQIARVPYASYWAMGFIGLAAIATLYDMIASRARMRRREAEIEARLAPFRPTGQTPSAAPSATPLLPASEWSWKRILVEIIGWYGAAGLLSAYLLSSFDVLHPNQPLYQILNVTAALGIVVVSLSKKNYQPAVLDIIWATIGTISLVKMFVS